MSTGNYTHVTRASGTVLTAAIYNNDHQNHINNANPQGVGGYSDDVTQMQAVWNPGAVGSEDLATTLAGELERIRYQLRAIIGGPYWYSVPAMNLNTFFAGNAIPPSMLQNGTQGQIIARLNAGTGPFTYSTIQALTALTPVAGDFVLGNTAATGNLRKIDVSTLVPATAQGNIMMRTSSGAGPMEQANIPSLTNRNPLVSGDMFLISLAAGGAPQRANIDTVAAYVGALSSGPPQGRLTLTANTPVMTAGSTGNTTVRYTPHITGRLCPIWNGTQLQMIDTGGELTQLLSDTTKSPAAAVAASNYDIFFWVDAGTPRISRGPAWTSATSRGSGAGTTELTRAQGLYVNANAITNGPAANRGTYLGTVRTNAANANIDYSFGGAASGGTLAYLSVWNAYNRVVVGALVSDSGASYTYNSTTPRQARASANNAISFVTGLAEDTIVAGNIARIQTAAVAGASGAIGLGLDATTYLNSIQAICHTPSAGAHVGTPHVTLTIAPQLGFHTLNALESGDGTNNATFNQQPSALTLHTNF